MKNFMKKMATASGMLTLAFVLGFGVLCVTNYALGTEKITDSFYHEQQQDLLTAVYNDLVATSTLANQLRTLRVGDGIINTTTLSIGSTSTKVGTTAFQYTVNGVGYHKAAVAAGTTLSAQTVPQSKWGIYKGSIDTSGTITLTAGGSNTVGYDSEVAAVADMPSTPANEAYFGYLTVSDSDSGFTAGTDDLDASGMTANFYSVSATVTQGAVTMETAQ